MKVLYNITVLTVIELLIIPFTECKRGLRVLRKVISNEEKCHRSNEIEIPRILIAPNADDTIIRDIEVLKYSKYSKLMNAPTPICGKNENSTFEHKKELMSCGELADIKEKKIEKICKKEDYAKAACPVTCDICTSITTTLPTTIVPTTAPTNSPTPICEEDEDTAFQFKKGLLTCGELADIKEKEIEKICKKKTMQRQLVQ